MRVDSTRKTACLPHGPPVPGSGDQPDRSSSGLSPHARNPTLPFASAGRRFLALSFTLTAWLYAVEVPRAEARNSTDEWVAAGGTVEVSTTTLTIREGETRSYSLRLTRRLPKRPPPNDDQREEGWWVRLFVGGGNRPDGEYDADGDGQFDIRWSPGAGWDFNPSDWPAEGMDDENTDSYWRNVTITAPEDDDEEDATIVFRHEVWDHDTYCPDALHPDRLPSVTVRVIDDDGPNAPKPELSIGDATVEEGGTARFEVRLDTDSERDVTVRYRTSNGTAQAGSDYEAVDDTLTIEAGIRSAFISVPTTEDAVYEGVETFTVQLSSPDRATLGDATGEGTITDDDDPPTLSIGNATVDEGDTAAFEVTLSGERAVTATVRYSTMDGTAFAGSDYTAIGGTLIFRPGDDTETIRVRTREDSAREETENFTVVLSDPQEATINTGTGTGTIDDDDAGSLPSLRIEDTTVAEGGTASFEVTLGAASTDTVTVEYVTADGTARGGDDYTAVTTPATLTFTPEDRSETITVATLQDQDYEGDETFTVRLSSPSMATIDDGTATGTIEDNDDPGISINDVTVREGSTAQFTVRLEGPTDHAVSVTAATSDGTAVAGEDYRTRSERLTIPARRTTAIFSVDTIADGVQDSNETFTVTLSNPSGATLDDDTGTGTITEGGGGGRTTRRLSIDDVSVEEGATAEFTVTLSRTSNRIVTVEVATSDGTAEAGDDYTAKSETLSIPAGKTEVTFSVDTIDDQDPESDEDFTVALSNPIGATLRDDTGTGNITDNDGGGGAGPQLSIADAAAVTEGETAQFAVTLTGVVDQTVTVGFETGGGTATADDDYMPASGTLTFTASDTTQTISVVTIDDTIREVDEGFTVTLGDPVGATIADGSATGTITDNDGSALPALSIADADPVTEGGTAQFEVTLSAESQQAVTVAYATADGTAVEDADYTSATGTLTFQPGDRTQIISVSTLDDSEQEAQEQFTVTLSGPGGATLDRDTGTATVDDNDAPGDLPQLSIEGAAAEEGETVQFTVTLTGNSNQNVSVDFQTGDGTAGAGSDYDRNAGTLTFTPGDRTRTIAVTTLEDTFREEDETFSVTLTNPAGATLAVDTATGTITDDDTGLPALSIADADPVTEGGTAQFEVTLSAESQQVVTVSYATADGTATEGSDYTAATATLRFQPGERTKTIPVTTLDDDEPESEEHFAVTLGNPTGATLDDSSGRGAITDDDDTAPRLSIVDASAEEGETVGFTVVLTGSPGETVTVGFETADGTALAGSDYEQTSGKLTFPPGSGTRTISVQSLEDDAAESDERFTVRLSDPDGATIEDGTAQGTIRDDDGGGTLPALTIEDAAPVAEGETASFPVTLSSPSSQPVTISYATADGTARAGSDYASTTGTLRFEPGETAQTIRVSALNDEIREDTEHFTVELSDPAGATLVGATGTGSITDDDEGMLPALTIDDAVPVAEGVTALFTVTLSAATAEPVTVAFATADGTAVAAADYAAAAGTTTFEPGTTRRTIEVATLEDDIEESAEDFTVELSDPSGAILEDDAGTGTIIDNDGGSGTLPEVSIGDAATVEGGTAEFEVTLRPASGQAVMVRYRTLDGTALEGVDYSGADGTLRFEPGRETLTIRVPVLDDDIREDTETFTVELSDPAGVAVADGAGIGTITDNDEGRLPALTAGDAAPVVEGGTARIPVTLSATSEQVVTVAFDTVDGSARGGADYDATFGTVTFQPGTRRQTIEVATRQDEIVESEETFTVELSDPSGATIEDDTGTGTITDDDLVDGLPALTVGDAAPVPEGVAVTFVVTLGPASERIVSVSYRTVDGTATAGPDYVATDGTLRFEPGVTSRTIAVTTLADELLEGAERFTVELSEPVAATIADGTGVGTITEAAERVAMVNRTVLPELGRALAFSTVRCRFERGLSEPSARNGSRGPAGYLSLPHAPTSDRQTSPGQQSLTLERALGDSSFFIPMQAMQDEEGAAGRFAAWGCGDYRYLGGGGGDGGVAWDGRAFSVNVGADVRLGSNALAGLSVSRSRGSFDYRAGGADGQAGGAYDLRLTGVHPYLGWSVSPGLDVWGTVGHAWGELRIVDRLVAGPLTSAATLDSGAAGVSGRLLERGATRLDLQGEAALARLDIAGDGALIEAMAVNMRRLRLSTEASRELVFSSGGSLTPWGELGLRHDDGDGRTGTGLEVGGGLRYQTPGAGWTTEGYGRWLAAHEGALREWGFGAVIRYDPGASGRGPSVSLMPGWGDTASGVQRLWERGATDPTVPRPPGSRLDAQFGYGLAAFRGRGVLTPFGRVSLDREYGNGYRVGSRIALGRSANLSLEVERRERAAVSAVYAIFVRGAWEF